MAVAFRSGASRHRWRRNCVSIWNAASSALGLRGRGVRAAARDLWWRSRAREEASARRAMADAWRRRPHTRVDHVIPRPDLLQRHHFQRETLVVDLPPLTHSTTENPTTTFSCVLGSVIVTFPTFGNQRPPSTLNETKIASRVKTVASRAGAPIA